VFRWGGLVLFIFKKSSTTLAQPLRRKEKGLSVDRTLKTASCHHFWKILKALHIVFLLSPNMYLSSSVTGAVAVTQALSESRMNWDLMVQVQKYSL